jgi:hypothetical protein
MGDTLFFLACQLIGALILCAIVGLLLVVFL